MAIRLPPLPGGGYGLTEAKPVGDGRASGGGNRDDDLRKASRLQVGDGPSAPATPKALRLTPIDPVGPHCYRGG